jgi:cell division inhibitor SepF
MGSVRRASAWLGLVDDGSDEQYYDEEYTDYAEGPESADAWATDPRMRVVEDATEEQGPCIATVTPSSFRDARGIGELFRDGVPVIMNLTAMEPSDAKRVVDFAAGLQFGLRGSIQRIAGRVFLLTPAEYQIVSGETTGRKADGFFNQS